MGVLRHVLQRRKAWRHVSTPSEVASGFAGAKMDGRYLSSSTAEYPASLAAALSEALHIRIGPSQSAHFALCQSTSWFTCPDGAGLNSTADHSNAKASPVTPLAHNFLASIGRWHPVAFRPSTAHAAHSRAPPTPIEANCTRTFAPRLHQQTLRSDCLRAAISPAAFGNASGCNAGS